MATASAQRQNQPTLRGQAQLNDRCKPEFESPRRYQLSPSRDGKFRRGSRRMMGIASPLSVLALLCEPEPPSKKDEYRIPTDFDYRQNRIKIPLAAYKQKNHNTINGRGTGVHAQGLCAGLAQHCFASCTLGEAHETASDQATTAGQPRVRMNANKLWEESNEQSKDPAP